MATMKKAQTGKSVKSSKLPPAPKKKSGMDAVKALGEYVSTFGYAKEGYNPAPSKSAKKTPKQKMGGVTKAKNGKSFPDLNKDGKITQKDILIGKGVLPKKAQNGVKTSKYPSAEEKVKIAKKLYKDNPGKIYSDAVKKAESKVPKKKMQYGGEAASMVPAMKSGGKMKKAGMHKMPDGSMMKNSMMKSGGAMKKCKYGCK